MAIVLCMELCVWLEYAIKQAKANNFSFVIAYLWQLKSVAKISLSLSLTKNFISFACLYSNKCAVFCLWWWLTCITLNSSMSLATGRQNRKKERRQVNTEGKGMCFAWCREWVFCLLSWPVCFTGVCYFSGAVKTQYFKSIRNSYTTNKQLSVYSWMCSCCSFYHGKK